MDSRNYKNLTDTKRNMDINENDNTIQEILREDEQETKNGKKKGCLARMLLFLIFILVVFLGFIFVQQYMLDMEAEAIVAAARTSTALASEPEKDLAVSTAEIALQPDPTATPAPSETPTRDPSAARTATVAFQLTQVAEFQMTASPQP